MTSTRCGGTIGHARKQKRETRPEGGRPVGFRVAARTLHTTANGFHGRKDTLESAFRRQSLETNASSSSDLKPREIQGQRADTRQNGRKKTHYTRTASWHTPQDLGARAHERQNQRPEEWRHSKRRCLTCLGNCPWVRQGRLLVRLSGA